MDGNELAKAFAEAGLDTPEKVISLLSKAAPALRLTEIDRACEALRREQSAAAQEVEAQIQALQAEASQIRETAAQLVSG